MTCAAFEERWRRDRTRLQRISLDHTRREPWLQEDRLAAPSRVKRGAAIDLDAVAPELTASALLQRRPLQEHNVVDLNTNRVAPVFRRAGSRSLPAATRLQLHDTLPTSPTAA